MKFIHTADIHWGMIPDSDKPWGKKREQAIRLTFQGIIEDARDSRADLLLISGDLFHRQPLARDLKEVNYLFSTIPGTRVVIIAGNMTGSGKVPHSSASPGPRTSLSDGRGALFRLFRGAEHGSLRFQLPHSRDH